MLIRALHYAGQTAVIASTRSACWPWRSTNSRQPLHKALGVFDGLLDISHNVDGAENRQYVIPSEALLLQPWFNPFQFLTG